MRQASLSQQYLLAIALPTYQRFFEYKRLVRMLSSEIRRLSIDDQALLKVVVYENPSDETKKKKTLFAGLDFGACLTEWNLNDCNIGGDANIEQAYSSQVGSTFVWVIGDDEQVLPGSFIKLLSYLKANPDLGLLLLRDTSYHVSKVVLDAKQWPSYEVFAKFVVSVQPHMLIAHTLISANIVRSHIFSAHQSKRERCITAPRSGLPFCFAHMRGILSGLSQANHLSVHLLGDPILDTTGRAEASMVTEDHDGLMNRLYVHHICWLSQEFGVSLWAFLMDDAFLPCLPPATTLLRVLSSKLKSHIFMTFLSPIRKLRHSFFRILSVYITH